MDCPRCQHQNEASASYCEKCAEPLARICSNCGRQLSATAKFCSGCAYPVAAALAPSRVASQESYTPKHLVEGIFTSRSALEGRRKQVTVLFVDVVGSSELARRLDPDEMYELMDQVLRLMAGAVHRCEGTVNQFLGDGIMALFSAPAALEDHALRAVHAALAIRQATDGLGERLKRERGIEMRIRQGLNTGFAAVGKIGDDLRMDYTAIGYTTHLAARLQQSAEPGTILMAESTHRLVEGHVECVSLGEREFKGLLPQRVFQVERLWPNVTRFDVAVRHGLSPLEGRRGELEALEECYRAARAGAIRVVSLVGEAGIGKSRVLYEFRERLLTERALFVQGHCSHSGRSTAFLPFIEVVRHALRLDEKDGPADILRKVRRDLEGRSVNANEELPFLLNLLGLNPESDAFSGLDDQIIGTRTRKSLEELLRARCRLSPVVLTIDDLHWTDSASEELLLRVMSCGEALPLLVLCAFRPEYQPPWAGDANVTQIVLKPLSDESCIRVIERRLGADKLPEAVARPIVEKAEGNPLFAEELTRYLVEKGSIVKTAAGYSFQVQEPASLIPETLRDLVMARVDRLPESARAVLEVASVIGRRFPHTLLETVCEAGGRLTEYARQLEASELVFHHAVEGRVEYVFKHALIQEAVYESLLKLRREALHLRIAEAVEQQYSSRLVERAEILAHHWSRTPRADKAIRYLTLAGQKSLRVYSLDEAHDFFHEAIKRMSTTPDSAGDTPLGDVLLSWARVYYYRKDFKGLIAMVEPYLARVEALGDSRRLSMLLSWVGFSHAYAVRHAAAKPLLDKALALGEALGDDECIGYACLAWMNFYAVNPAGQPRDVVDRLADRGLTIARRLGDLYLESYCLLWLALHKAMSGRYNAARELAAQLLGLGRKASDARTIAMGLYVISFAHLYDDQFEEALENAEEAARISPDPLAQLAARAATGMAMALMGRAREGSEILSDVRRQCMENDFLTLGFSIEIPYGAAMVLAGQLSSGTRWIRGAVQRMRRLGCGSQEAFGQMILGEIHLGMALGERRPPLSVVVRNVGFLLRTLPFAASRARFYLEEAVRLASDFDLPGIRARALHSLALLSRAKRRHQEARFLAEEAHKLAEPNSGALAEKIRKTLESLGPAIRLTQLVRNGD